MTMHVNLSPEMEVFIRNKFASGFYGNASEAIRDAIRCMQAEEGRVAVWQAAIEVGDEQLECGEGRALHARHAGGHNAACHRCDAQRQGDGSGCSPARNCRSRCPGTDT